MTVSDADRLSGRAAVALEDAMRDNCRREISPAFVRAALRLLNEEPGFFLPLHLVRSSRDLGGSGEPLEREVLTEAKRLCAFGGVASSQILEIAIANSLHNRNQSDIRATAAVLPVRNAKSTVVLSHMQADASAADARAIAREVCERGRPATPARGGQRLDADEDLLGRGAAFARTA
jgi:hypothetical protein